MIGPTRRRCWWSPAVTAEWTLGFVEQAAGKTAEAADRLLALTAPDRPDRNPIALLEAMPDAVEAGFRAGRRAEAAERLATLRGWVAGAPSEARRALLARCEALLLERDPDEAFSEAIALGGELPPLQRAHTQLLNGEWLRRERAPHRGPNPLAVGCGSVRGARRGPLGRTRRGRAARNRRNCAQARPGNGRTPDPAGTAERGSGRQRPDRQGDRSAPIHQPRTVDYHLRKVFTKLGIASRIDLVRGGLVQPDPA